MPTEQEQVTAVPRIEVRDLAKQFAVRGGVREVVDNVSFDVAPGEFVSVIGPSGCGKSTMFNILAGLETPTSGEVRVDGRDAIGHREHFAYMPQKDLLFPWRTIAENAALGLEVQGVPRRKARAQARELFPAFGLAGFEDSHPFELSGGMRQRAALLRTVVQGREILLLDEPFGALDSLTRIEMQNWLQGVWSDHSWTAVLITHDIREAVYLSDRVIVLSARPTRVRLDVRIDLERPRDLAVTTSAEFAAYEQQLIEVLHDESRKAFAQQQEGLAS
ncbi:ABC transporter ATP-binding protein [Nocardioides mangrovi]|uniref:ABC transporter ATP-binding protein n=1 Tax=Nocardioides mangrovi TaxID=2874580 RepID=A0ABS7UF81_9ACTN|nr:ABC transporter ATP-binding protein [Nocardioides mangrovi]MBZ5739500.1 ABC transporter ATP-binding protein [Nocardioides mangrovi]